MDILFTVCNVIFIKIDDIIRVKYSMDCFIQDLLRDKLLPIEEDNSDNDSDSDESVDSIDDNDSDCWKLPISDDDDDDDIIFISNVRDKLIVDIITAPSNADVGTGTDSTSVHRRRHDHGRHDHGRHDHGRRLSVALVSDNAKVFAVARPEVFRRMEDIKKQKDRWDANHGTHINIINDNNNNNTTTNKYDLKREMSDSILLVANTCRKQQQHRDFRRGMSDSMLVIPKRIFSDLSEELAITDKAKKDGEDEGHDNGNDNDKYKLKSCMVTTNKTRISKSTSLNWNDKTTTNRNAKSNYDRRKKCGFGRSLPTCSSSAKLSTSRRVVIPSSLFPKKFPHSGDSDNSNSNSNKRGSLLWNFFQYLQHHSTSTKATRGPENSSRRDSI
jgi:hypothetical protein